jgi:ABC-type transporter Mla subunit MlaD
MAGERVFKVQILGNADGAIAAFKKLGREGERTLGQLQTVGKVLGGAFDFVKKAAFIAGAAIGAVGAASFVAVQKASDLNETITKSNVIFGDAARTVQAFADTAARSLGQTRQEAIDAAATFGTFGKVRRIGRIGTCKLLNQVRDTCNRLGIIQQHITRRSGPCAWCRVTRRGRTDPPIRCSDERCRSQTSRT